ncbi:hypothetical protein N8I84_42065 (plasmid) [Streptomyces cynarae]|uniref:Uncharacterized protein n=1 Tax=Streptomyces cynarae TaxID=2981134 RepID=A0ABY6EEC4_9ACTN|nr:hypothetical protein [Streptomyces cynarae]UXY25015.1 hypothetical protein N8I84_42065 [Streptomyces cynarae]
MTTTAQTSRAASDEDNTPPLGELLLRSARNPRERAAVQALVDEEQLLDRPNVRSALVTKENGTMTCQWTHFAGRLYTLSLTDGERAFLSFVAGMVGGRETSLTWVEELDERRLAIVLRSLARLAGCDTIAVGTRL